MFTKINIKKFGLYKDFTWPEDLPEFGRVNIIYGRNYSGKTTLSRIFDCVGQGRIHQDYLGCDFELVRDTSAVVCGRGRVLECEEGLNDQVRVYNSDFVKRNLSWLNNEEGGEIRSFALLGEGNKKVQEEIDDINEQLGSEEKEKGLRYDLAKKNKFYEKWRKELNTSKTKLENQLKDKANSSIKTNSTYVKPGTAYDVSNLKADILLVQRQKEAGTFKELSNEDIRWLELIEGEAEKPMIALLPENEPQMADFMRKVGELMERRIQMTQTLRELVENDLLQAWVDEGRHVNKYRETCAFCGNPISKKRREALNAHFNKESEQLKADLTDLRTQIVAAKTALDGYLESRGMEAQNIYATFYHDYNARKDEWDAYVKQYKATLDEFLGLIDKRLGNLFKPIDANIYNFAAIKGGIYLEIVKRINTLINKNNEYGMKMDAEKQKARDTLRLQEVYHFCRDIHYEEERKRIEDEDINMMGFAADIGSIRGRIKGMEALLELKELEKRDEGLAAQKVTNLLANHFGNESLRLESETDAVIMKQDGIIEPPKQTRFVVKRGEAYAKNLSEGEKSLISFCYFIAQIEDELNGPDAGELVIFIDDPISSLDNSHIYFMYSLIDTMIAKPTKFGQLFISTHNLEFLRLIKNIKLSGPKGSKTRCNYVVVKFGKGNTNDYRSEIRKMPEYLSKYTTEYNFLFEQIYEVAELNNEEEQELYGEKYTQYYNIGNNMRKFLECYLFNRYPDTDDPLSGHIAQLFDDHVPSEVNRVVNEYSHLKWAERGMRVMEVPEVVTAAKEIIKALKTKDFEHYETLCKSVGVAV